MLNYLLGIMQWQDKKPSVSVANKCKLREWYTVMITKYFVPWKKVIVCKSILQLYLFEYLFLHDYIHFDIFFWTYTHYNSWLYS